MYIPMPHYNLSTSLATIIPPTLCNNNQPTKRVVHINFSMSGSGLPVPPPTSLSLPDTEEELIKFWQDKTRFPAGSAFLQSIERNKDKPVYRFYDGPPFATGLPHHGHILAGTIKDVVTRWAHQTGHNVERRFGWDCHGVPVENEVNKKFNIKGRADVEDRADRGIKWYNDECRSIVQTFVKEWRHTTNRIGRWIDFDNDYKTLDPDFMETVWSVFKRLWDTGRVYRGVRVMPMSTALGSPLSKHEVGPETYHDAVDPQIVVAFKVTGDVDEACLVAWTTTPWTLPSNIALCVNADMDYVKLRSIKGKFANRVFIMAHARTKELFKSEEEFKVLESKKGKDLVGTRYEALFPGLFTSPEYFTVVSDGYVTDKDGTGVVHLAPAFGEDDFRVAIANGVIKDPSLATSADAVMPCPVDDEGHFRFSATQIASFESARSLDGKYVKAKETDQLICGMLKSQGKLLTFESIQHKVPFCARSRTPLIYKAVPSWFVRVESVPPGSTERSLREEMLEQNQKTRWVPDFIGTRRFHDWLAQARDWNVSRNRYWGTPIPIWTSKDGSEVICIGSIKELETRTGKTGLAHDLHRQFMDGLEIPSQTPGNPPLRRVTEVFDCWFESGSMPYAQQHYMISPQDPNRLPPGFPAEFIAEGLDQTRGWFYTLMVLSTALFKQPPFKNVIVNGLVLAADGKKMSKSLKNFPPPLEVVSRHGADALRMYLVNSPVVRGEPLRFMEDGVQGAVREVFLPLLNAYRFLLQNVHRAGIADKFSVMHSAQRARESTNIMDRWIQAELKDLISSVRLEMSQYKLYTVMPRLLLFVDSLTNWYVRLNRNRLKGVVVAAGGHGGDDGEEEDGGGGGGVGTLSEMATREALASLSTLYEVLLTASTLMAPFTPFFSEFLYQGLCAPSTGRRSAESVHFLPIPETTPIDKADEAVLRAVRALQGVVALGRTARDKAHLKMKRPVVRVIVVAEDPDQRRDLEQHVASYCTEELNTFKLEFPQDPDSWGRVRVTVDCAALGKRLRKQADKVKQMVEACANPKALLQELKANGKADVGDGNEVLATEVNVSRVFETKENHIAFAHASNDDGTLMVVIETTDNAQVAASTLGREFKSVAQKLRKKSGFQPGQLARVFFALTKGKEECKELEQSVLQSGVFPTGSLFFMKDLPAHAVVQATTTEVLSEFGDLQLTVKLTRPFVNILTERELSTDVVNLIASLDTTQLAGKTQITVNVDGKQTVLVKGRDFVLV